ncbi:hypothetical protein GQ53DRAFT_364925 [Thozetella sp. PMI_491]|nr:hypothetical protein GQ53DRAFT_364925 [Thozetella sp. PMI_491]
MPLSPHALGDLPSHFPDMFRCPCPRSRCRGRMRMQNISGLEFHGVFWAAPMDGWAPFRSICRPHRIPHAIAISCGPCRVPDVFEVQRREGEMPCHLVPSTGRPVATLCKKTTNKGQPQHAAEVRCARPLLAWAAVRVGRPSNQSRASRTVSCRRVLLLVVCTRAREPISSHALRCRLAASQSGSASGDASRATVP